MPRLVSLIVLLAIVLLIGLLFIRVVAVFVLPLFLALILVVIFRPMYRWMVDRFKGRQRLAAAVTMLAILLIVLVPLSLVLTFAGIEATAAFSGLGRERLGGRWATLRQRLGLELPVVMADLDALVAQLEDRPFSPDRSPARQVADALLKEVQTLRQRLDLPQANQGPVKAEAEPPTAGERLSVALADFEMQLQDLVPEEAGSSAAVDEVQTAYYTQVRPLLVPWLEPRRVHAYLVLAANPSPQQIADLRQQAFHLLGSESLGPLALATGQRVGGFLIQLLIGFIIMMVAVYYFLADGPEMISTLMKLAPLDRKYVEELVAEFGRVSRAVVMATLLSALAQGLLGGLGYWLAGFESVFLLTVLTMALALVPFVGATAVWLPCCLWLLFHDGRTAAAIMLGLYGMGVISMVDNLIKPAILHGQSNLHPLLALLSVLGGVMALGPIGVFVGPMAVAFLQALLYMLHTELTHLGTPPASKAA
jgi:predicted PurR-regulated permease PerM